MTLRDRKREKEAVYKILSPLISSLRLNRQTDSMPYMWMRRLHLICVCAQVSAHVCVFACVLMALCMNGDSSLLKLSSIQ